jgi:hypothetical protein
VVNRVIDRAGRGLGNERGVAMPLALILLVVVSAMMVAFAVLANTEPMIASNQQRTAQALSLADSGMQLALWALSNPTDGHGLDSTVMTHDGSTVAGTYDGTHFVALGGTGGFTVQVTWDAGNGTYERTVTAVGWTPAKDADFLNSHRKIHAIVQLGVVPPLDPPCVLCVAGEVQVNGSAATLNSASGGCPGMNPPATAVQTVQALRTNGSPRFDGYGTTGTAATLATPDTNQYKYPADSLAKLKAIAQANGTYYRGSVSSIPSSGIIYVDTVDGTAFTQSTPTSNDGVLNFSGSGDFSGTIVVAGTVNLSGTHTINGLVYSLNDLSVSGHITVNGGMISENRRDSSSTNIDTDVSGSVTLNYDCPKIRSAGGQLSQAWIVKTGGYLETEGY